MANVCGRPAPSFPLITGGGGGTEYEGKQSIESNRIATSADGDSSHLIFSSLELEPSNMLFDA